MFLLLPLVWTCWSSVGGPAAMATPLFGSDLLSVPASLSTSRRGDADFPLHDKYPDTAKVEAEQLRNEAAALAAIQRDTANMDAQRKAFEAETRAINQRINQVEKLVEMDLRGMERSGGAGGGARV